MSDEKPGRAGDDCPGPDGVSDAELTDEQIDAEAPGVDDAGELEAAEAEIAAEAEADEDKVVTARQTAVAAGSPRATTTTRTTTSRCPQPPRRPHRPPASTRPGPAPAPARPPSGPRAQETRQRRSLRRFLREVVAELRKVIWPGRRELITYTTVVIVFVAFIVALVAGLDLVFAKAVLAVFG